MTAAVDKIVKEAGALHGMVVNAGRTNHKSALDFTQAEIEALFNVNVSLFEKLQDLTCWTGYMLTGAELVVWSFLLRESSSKGFHQA